MLDPSLRGFVEAADEAAAERRLAELLERDAAPLIRRIAGRKLAGGGTLSSTADLDDIVADALLALVARLQELRAGAGAEPIEDFAGYTATVTYNAYAHHVRRAHPERTRLKQRLRYVLSRDRRFALWETPDGLACGLAHWRPGAVSPAATEALRRLATEPERLRRWTRKGSDSVADTAALVRGVLQAAGGAVHFDVLVAAVAGITPFGTESGPDVGSLPDAAAVPADIALDRRRLTERLWQEVGALPLRQRVALLLGLRDARGASLLWVLPLTGTASIRQIADALEMPHLELASLWNGLPLDDHSIAGRLGATRQQVINLRSAARKRLSNRLVERGQGGGWPRTAANTRAVSPSLEDET
jgi:DNA-directed RNA polymerase specialized sigma24 family protein